MTHRMRSIAVRFVLASAVLATCTSPPPLAGQTPGGGVVINNVSPWVDIMAYGAKCDGMTDDTAAIQSALAYVNTAGYGRVFVPYTGHLCVVNGYTSGVPSGYSISTGTGTMTITVANTPPSWIGAGALLDIYGATYGTSGCSGGYTNLGCNGVWPVISVTPGTPYSTITVSTASAPSNPTGSSSAGNVSVGLWSTAILDIEGECTTRQDSASCSGFAVVSSTGSPIYMLSSGPSGGILPGTNAISVKHLNFLDGGWNGITAGFTENGYVVNNKFYGTIYPVTIRNKLDGTLFLMNHAICQNGTSLITGSIAFDLGYLWTNTTSATSTGGENTMFANQVEWCGIGYMVDGQNDDNVISKAELTATSPSQTIGFDVLNSSNIWVDAQTLYYCTGIHVDAYSSSVHLTNPRLGNTSSSGPHCNSTSQPDGDTFTAGTIVADTGAQYPYITVSGFTPGTSGYLLAGNSTFSNDSVPGLSFHGSSSGAVTLKPPASFTNYNWNWPASAGTSGQLLTSAGGGTSAMTWTSSSFTLNGGGCSLGGMCTLTLDQVASPLAPATFTDANYPVSFTSIQTTANQSAISFTEASAASGSADNEVQVGTLSGSTSVPLSISQGSLNGTPSPSALSVTSTWNNGSLTPTLISASVTNSASMSGSLLLNLLAGPSGTTSEFSVAQSGLVTTNGNIVSGGHVQVVSGNNIRSNSVSGAMVLQSGQDSTVQTTAALLTVRGFDLNGGSGTSTRAGNALVRGGNNEGTPGSGTSDAGSFESEAGACTATTTHCVNGLSMSVSANFQSSPTTQFGVECLTATARTVTDCPISGSSAAKFIGIALTAANPIMTVYAGEVPVLTDNSATVGHYLTFGTTTAGEAHDSGTTVSTTVGATLGVVEATSGSYTLPDGTPITLSSTEPLVMLRPF